MNPTWRRRLAVLVATSALLAAGCGSRGKEDPLLRLSAAESLAEGKQLLERKRYSAARPYLAHAFEIEPNSAAGREALLLVADSLFLEGGESNLIQAEAKYRDFQNRFPTSDRAPYVQFQIASALARRIDRPDRDQAASAKSLLAFEELLRLYPTSEYAERASEEIRRVRRGLAEHEFLVGRFYLRYGLPIAAVGRLETLLTRYPEYPERDKALLHLGLAYQALQRADEARETFSKLETEFPQSPFRRKIPRSRP